MRALGALTVLVLLARPVGGQEVEAAPRADLNLTVHPTGEFAADIWIDVGVADADRVTKGLSTIVPCAGKPVVLSESDSYNAWTTCRASFERNHLVTSGELDFTVLVSALKAEGIRNIDVSIQHSNTPHVEVDPRWESSVTKTSGSTVRYQFSGELADLPSQSLAVAFGFNAEHRGQLATVLATVLFGPAVLVLLAGLLVHSGPRIVDPAWFGSYSAGAAGLVIFHLSWGITPHAGLLDPFAAYLLNPWNGTAAWYEFWWRCAFWAPPILGGCLAVPALHVIRQRLGGSHWTLRDTLAQAFWGQLRYFWPLQCVLIATGRIHYGEWAELVAWLAAAWVGYTWCASLGESAKKVTLNAAGPELQARVAELAATAGVPPPGVWVKKHAHDEVIGAWAAPGLGVLVSEDLLKHLTRRQVDAVVAHELKHLKSSHPWLLFGALVFCIGVAYAVGLGLLYYFRPAVPEVAFDLAVTAAGMLGYLAVSRYVERSADAAAVDICDDPEAFIRGLAKVSGIAESKAKPGRLAELWMSHPGYRERIELVAKRGGISLELIDDIVCRTDDASGFYEAAREEGGEFDDTRVLSKSVRAAFLTKVVRTETALRIAIGLVAALVIPHLAATAEAIVSWMVSFSLVALCVTLGFEFLANHFGLREFREKIDERLRQKGHIPGDPEVLRATFSPNADCRNYESFSWYDEGLLYRCADGLAFIGDATNFTLCRKQIVAIEEEVRRDWLSDRDLRVKWIDEGGCVQEFRLADAYENEFKAFFHSEFSTKIQRWFEGAGPFIEAPGRRLDAPHFDPPIQGEPNVALTPALMLKVAAQFSIFTFLAAAFLGFDLGLEDVTYSSGWYAVGVAGFTTFLLSWWTMLRDLKTPPPLTAPADELPTPS